MNRSKYFNYIEDKLAVLALRINAKGKLNILDLHNHSENFYAYLISCVYGWDCFNANPVKQNIEAIDLVDHTNKLIIQVSSTNTKQKLESALDKKIVRNFPAYTFKFISISKDASRLRGQIFMNPHNVSFNPVADILDNGTILSHILSSNIDKQKEVYELIQKELGGEIDIVKLDSNLAVIINLLSKEDLHLTLNTSLNSFEIERKITHNSIDAAKFYINEYTKYHPRLDKKYNEFDALGLNKSLSVLQLVNSVYIESLIKYSGKGSDFIFYQVLEMVKDKVVQSANHSVIPIDELELCVRIIVVDAFIRCKIFENPQSYNYASA